MVVAAMTCVGKTLRLVLIAACLSNVLAFAGSKSTAKPNLDPETRVTISIFDLVKRGSKTPMSAVSGLQRKYVEEVLDMVRGQKEKILGCLGESSKISIQFRLEIETNGAGKAIPLNSNSGASACLTGILTDVKYPPHKLARKVEIEFPLELERRSF